MKLISVIIDLLKNIGSFILDFMFLKKTRKLRISGWWKTVARYSDYHFLHVVLILCIAAPIIYYHGNFIQRNKYILGICFLIFFVTIMYLGYRVAFKNKKSTERGFTCPYCSCKLIKRTRNVDGRVFFGCPNFEITGCSHTRNVE